MQASGGHVQDAGGSPYLWLQLSAAYCRTESIWNIKEINGS